MPTSSTNLAAIIEFGSTSVRMAVAQRDKDGELKLLESLEQLIGLGRDTFTTQSISYDSMEQGVAALRAFLEKLKIYDIPPQNLRIVATSAVREAENCMEFVDRIRIATGVDIDVLDEPEISRLVYRAMQAQLQDERFFKKGNTLVIEVGGGNTQCLLFRKGRVIASHEYRLGSQRIERDLKGYQLSSQTEDLLREYLHQTISMIVSDVKDAEHLTMVAMGSELRFACRFMNPDWNDDELGSLTTDDLEKFTRKLLRRTPEETARLFNMSLEHAENMAPALFVIVRVARELKIKTILVGEGSLRRGALLDLLAEESWNDEFQKQVTSSAMALAERYNANIRHSNHVATYAHQLLEALREMTSFSVYEEIILDVAARLHEIGTFVNVRAYHKHSLYLIENSEIFGISSNDLRIAARVARYHRHSVPKMTHTEYATLSPEARITVSKLAAILRVANALDHLRPYKAFDIKARISGNRFLVTLRSALDLSLTRSQLTERSEMFRTVFGLKVVLNSGQELD